MYEEMGFYDVKKFNDLMKINNYFRGKMISPGGAASLCGVTRQAVQNWILRKRIRAFRYNGVYGEYILIPLDDLKKYKGVTDNQYEFFKYMKEVK